NSITRAERARIVSCLKNLVVPISGLRPVEEAVVTAGGVSVKEINPKTMESKLVPGLYFAGEIIDVDGYTGGYNLQIAWSTGHAAGIAAAFTGNNNH
ncbi:MAG: NAD(P)/FAD-dependent oxidoreductase, partial [Eubacteriales bacterium]